MGVTTQYINLSSGEMLSFTVTQGGYYIESAMDAITVAEKIHNNLVSQAFRIFILYADETIAYEIAPEDIKLGGSYSENYQNGQRRSLNFTLYNHTGKYSPSANFLTPGTKIKFEMGAELTNGQTIWFNKGIFIVQQVSVSHAPQGREVNVVCGDKFSLFEGNAGRLQSTYEIPTGTPIKEAIESFLLMDLGNGVIADPKPIIYHSSFLGKKTQCSISHQMGDKMSSLLLDLATQLSAEMFYNSNGNLVVTPSSEVTDDRNKPLLYNFTADDGDFNQLSLSVNYDQIINKVIVMGSSSSGGTYQATAVNDNSLSPFCYQKIGFRVGEIVRDGSIFSNYLAQERADYELRKQMILKTTTSATVLYNPLLEVNNLVSITDDFLDLMKTRFLLQGISCSLDYSNQMSITVCSLENLPFLGKK